MEQNNVVMFRMMESGKMISSKRTIEETSSGPQSEAEKLKDDNLDGILNGDEEEERDERILLESWSE
jgi:hypothetical protein